MLSPFPSRCNMDCLAVYLESTLLVNRYYCQFIASGCSRRFQQAVDFPLSCIVVRHIPRNLYRFIDMFIPLN